LDSLSYNISSDGSKLFTDRAMVELINRADCKTLKIRKLEKYLMRAVNYHVECRRCAPEVVVGHRVARAAE